MFLRLRSTCFLAGIFACSLAATGQEILPTKVSISSGDPSHSLKFSEPGYELEPGEDPQNRLLLPFAKHFATDQQHFWTSPLRFHSGDLRWMVPLAAASTVLVASDSWVSRQVPDKPGQLVRSKSISNSAALSLAGMAASSFFLGRMNRDDHLAETGLLAGEAAINATAVNYLLKMTTQRPRPDQANISGTFFRRGTSFPSEHSALAWSVASVWAHEYPGALSQSLVYGLASAVTLTRVTSKQHYASDAVVGGLLGWYFGRQAYRAHHDKELGGASWESIWPEQTPERPRNPANMGSPYVQLDSWVYPALERLAALGYVESAYLGMRPWTRLACASLLQEANENTQFAGETEADALDLYDALVSEFSEEMRRLDGASNVGASWDSIYTRVTDISGWPLRDGYHFGQTITNDYGRPYGEGFNNVTGLIAHAVTGPFSLAIQGEYQHAPALPSSPPNVLQQIASADVTLPVSNGFAAVSRFHLLDTTVAFTFRGLQLSLGRESLWLGPGETGPLLFSNDAPPVLMLKLDNITPYRVSLLSRLLGPVRSQYFLGRLSGHRFELNGNQLLGPANITPQPFLDGAKFSFKPTPNLEMGIGFTAMFAGPGLPFTWGNFIRTFYVHHDTGATASGANPGKRISSADFNYRVPGLRNWLTIYSDALVVDEVSPLTSPRATVNPGIYIPQFPKLPRLELRAEGIHEPITREFAPGFVYYGSRRYRSGYTNDGSLMGNWIGRAGRGAQGWLTYTWTPRNQFQLGYRLQEVSRNFIQGGRLADYSARGNFMLSPKLALTGSVQYEQRRFPALATTTQSNMAASLEMTFYPQWRLRK